MKRFLSLFISISILFSVFINFFVRDANQVRAAAPEGFEQTTVVGTGLDAPTGFEIAPDGRIFILERAGEVKIFKDG